MDTAVALNEDGRVIGQDHPNARHSDREVDVARQLRADGLSLKQIADRLDTKKSTIASWLNGRRRNQIQRGWRDAKT